ncbi:MAG: HpcH/HpaI aldolase/citrate lyase family protein [Candidatus Bathyarchaeia archaeon]
MVKKNRLKEIIREGRVAVGTGIYSFSPAAVEVAGYAGLDFVYIDTEHTPVDWQTLENLVRAAEIAGVTPIIRPEENDSTFIRKCLEIGAQGVLVPHVSTKEEAVRAVRAARFPPRGVRGAAGIVRSAEYSVRDWVRYVEESDREAMVIVMTEEEKAIDNLEEILSVEGIDAVCVGFVDLSISLGLPGQVRHPRVQEAFGKVIVEAKRRGIAVMCSVSPPYAERARELVERGVRVLIFGHDVSLLYRTWQGIASEIREALRQ